MTTAPLPTGPLYTLWKIGGEHPDCAFLPQSSYSDPKFNDLYYRFCDLIRWNLNRFHNGASEPVVQHGGDITEKPKLLTYQSK